MRVRRTASLLSAVVLAIGGIALASAPSYADDGDGCAVPPGANVIVGTAGNDTLVGTVGPDVFFGLDGDDVIFGGPGRDRIHGGGGDDKMYGGDGEDCLDGQNGWDRGDGGADADVCSVPATEVRISC